MAGESRSTRPGARSTRTSPTRSQRPSRQAEVANQAQNRPAASAPLIAAPVAMAGAIANLPLKAWQRLTGTERHGRLLPCPEHGDLRHLRAGAAGHQLRLFDDIGGTAFFLADRTYVGAEQYQRLLDCANYLDAATCREDLFWKAVHNTALVRRPAGGGDDGRVAGNRADPQPRDSWPQLLARGVLLPGAAVARRRRPDLALDPAAPGAAQPDLLRARRRAARTG